MIWSPEIYFIFACITCFCLGVHFGKAREAAKWRANATSMFRIESAGLLFKVSHASNNELNDV